jgi:hypothetical protein
MAFPGRYRNRSPRFLVRRRLQISILRLHDSMLQIR